jgi:hypothetical protein
MGPDKNPDRLFNGLIPGIQPGAIFGFFLGFNLSHQGLTLRGHPNRLFRSKADQGKYH